MIDWTVGWKLIDDNTDKTVIFLMNLFKFSNRDTKMLLIHKALNNKQDFIELWKSATYFRSLLDSSLGD